jgi:hypothetical protein
MKQSPAFYYCKWQSAFHCYSHFLCAFLTTHGYIIGLYLLTPWSRVLLEKETSKLCS